MVKVEADAKRPDPFRILEEDEDLCDEYKGTTMYAVESVDQSLRKPKGEPTKRQKKEPNDDKGEQAKKKSLKEMNQEVWDAFYKFP